MSGDFANSYLGRLRAKIGHDLVHVPGVRIVIENDRGEILLHHRPDFNVWGLPGGGPETGQNVIEQATRETEEETGIAIFDPLPFGFASNPVGATLHYPNGDVCHYHDLMFLVTRYEGQLVTRNDESLAVNWFSYDALPEVLPNVALTVEALLRFRASGEFQLI